MSGRLTQKELIIPVHTEPIIAIQIELQSFSNH